MEPAAFPLMIDLVLASLDPAIWIQRGYGARTLTRPCDGAQRSGHNP